MADDKNESPDLRKELNSLWKSTIDQFDEIKNVIVRSSGAGKAKLDATFLKRQRDKLLSELGARVLTLAERGDLTLPSELDGTAGRIRELEREIEDQEGEVDRLLRPDEVGESQPVARGDAAQDDDGRDDDPRDDTLDALSDEDEQEVTLTAEPVRPGDDGGSGHAQVTPHSADAETTEVVGAPLVSRDDAASSEDPADAATEPPRVADEEEESEGKSEGGS